MKNLDFALLNILILSTTKFGYNKNNTDIDLGEELVNLGIPKADIVVGFLACPETSGTELERAYSGYGMANVLELIR